MLKKPETAQKFSILFLTISMNTLGITRLPVEIHFM